MPNWCAVAVMTRSAPCSGAIARRSGFSLDLKELVQHFARPSRRALHAAIRAPWSEGSFAVPSLPDCAAWAAGETVVCVLPGHEHEVDEFDCDRELVRSGGAVGRSSPLSSARDNLRSPYIPNEKPKMTKTHYQLPDATSLS